MESLRDKMYNYEVNPPSHCWEKISIDLDDSAMSLEFPSNLYNMEVAPPATAWEKVNAALNPTPEAVVKPIAARLSPVIKYAAAAITVGIIAFAVLKLIINNNNNPEIANRATENNDTIKSGKNLSEEPNGVVISPNDLAKEDESAEQNRNSTASFDPPAGKITKRQNPNTGGNKIRESRYPESDLSYSIYAYEDHVPDIAERYVMLMTPDGNFIRMSKKWSDLLCCVSGEEQDPDCKNQLKKWQQKIATSPLAPSPANFMDILGLVNSLEDDTEL